MQSDRDSLVTGTATGFLVAVSLSPPAAVLGLALVLGRWDYVGNMAFLLGLTFASILTGGWVAMRLGGVRPGAVAARSGTRARRNLLAGGAAVAVAALVLWQAQQSPGLLKADLARAAVEVTRRAVSDAPAARYVEASAHFTRPDTGFRPGESMLLRVTVQKADASDADAAVEAVASSGACSPSAAWWASPPASPRWRSCSSSTSPAATCSSRPPASTRRATAPGPRAGSRGPRAVSGSPRSCRRSGASPPACCARASPPRRWAAAPAR
jgi:hypothetical protein